MKSHGICLFRYSTENACWQLLSVKKNFTNHYTTFIKSDFTDIKKLKTCVKNMTHKERIHILNNSLKDIYQCLGYKFYNVKLETAYQKVKSKSWFFNMIKSTPGDTQWELPRGKAFNKEWGLRTAIRELKEETSLSDDCYTIIGNKCYYTISDDKVYHQVYYGAILRTDVNINKNVIDKFEIEDVKWINLHDITKYKGGEHMFFISNHLFKGVPLHKFD